MRQISFTTNVPSPYQVELFDALASSGKVSISVLYERRRSAQRLWRSPKLSHDYLVLDEVGLASAVKVLDESDLVVFSGYRCQAIRTLISKRQNAGRPWVFWGERLGFRMPVLAGRLYRRVVFRQLHREKAPVWGIGTCAVEEYRKEFGSDRLYCNVPYFSSLAPFFAIDRLNAVEKPRRILFSGSLIERKGVDVLLQAFRILASELRDLELHLIGDGPLRKSLEHASKSLSERVVFHGFKQWDELPGFYKDADILCAPSRYDGWGLIVPEAMAAGLLVISTDRTGSALDLIGSDVGWRVPAGSVDKLVDAIRQAAETSGLQRQSRIMVGRQRAKAVDVREGIDTLLAAIDLSMLEGSRK